MATLTKCDALNKSIAYYNARYFEIFDTELGKVMSIIIRCSADNGLKCTNRFSDCPSCSIVSNDTQSAEYAQSLNKILGMMESLKGINTDNVEPLKSPLIIRNLYVIDVSESNHRDEYQAVAPATEAGLYLVPRVIE